MVGVSLVYHSSSGSFGQHSSHNAKSSPSFNSASQAMQKPFFRRAFFHNSSAFIGQNPFSTSSVDLSRVCLQKTREHPPPGFPNCCNANVHDLPRTLDTSSGTAAGRVDQVR